MHIVYFSMAYECNRNTYRCVYSTYISYRRSSLALCKSYSHLKKPVFYFSRFATLNLC